MSIPDSGAGPLNRKSIFALMLAFVSIPAVSESEQEERARYTKAMEIYGEPTLHIPHVEGNVEIDGSLSEEAWQHAASVEIAWQLSPSSNVPAKVRTIAFLTFTDRS